MSGLSLEKSIRTCKVNVGWSNRIQSDRFLNSANLLCPTWVAGVDGKQNYGYDLAGRQVCQDSFYTKSPGCNPSTDRIVVENDLRPDYVSYIALNAAGIKGAVYGNQSIQNNANAYAQSLNDLNKVTGHFNNDFMSNVQNNSCSLLPYDAMMKAQQQKNGQAMFNAYFANGYRSASGNAAGI